MQRTDRSRRRPTSFAGWLCHSWCGDVEGERVHLEQALELYRHKEIVHWTR